MIELVFFDSAFNSVFDSVIFAEMIPSFLQHSLGLAQVQTIVLDDPVENIYGVAIALLLPITATVLVVQTNPYYALVLRGIVGAVAALVYALFGAADVALTEALIGTMLSITLYAIAVRSSLSMRLGILESPDSSDRQSLDTLTKALRQPLQHQHLRLELVPYPNLTALRTALEQKEVHSIAVSVDAVNSNIEDSSHAPYEVCIRVRRVHSILSQLPQDIARFTYVALPDTVEAAPTISTQSIFEPSDFEPIEGAKS